MNHGGIARRLINFACILGGRLPCPLAHCNILANMLFGAISGSAVASAAAMGGVMHPQQVKEGYDPAFSTAVVNVASTLTGLLIPPSNTLIVYSLVSGGTSIAALFLRVAFREFAGSGTDGNSRYYRGTSRLSKARTPDFTPAGAAIWMAIPSIFLIILIMGVYYGIFTLTEASAIAVIYTLLALVLYREISVEDLPKIFLNYYHCNCLVINWFFDGYVMAMSNADVPS